jgi:hypothetical protein
MRFKYEGRSYGVSAQKAGERLKEIENRDGLITPQAVVEDARPEGSLLHPVFEWDDEKAAEAYRIHQAGSFIRCIVVVPEKEGKSEEPVRLFVNTKPTDDGQKRTGTYINFRSAMEDPKSRSVILSNAKHEMLVFKKKYSQLEELSLVFMAIDKTLKEVG